MNPTIHLDITSLKRLGSAKYPKDILWSSCDPLCLVFKLVGVIHQVEI